MFAFKNSISIKFSCTMIAGICILMASTALFSYHFQKKQTIEGLKNTIKQTADRIANNIVHPLWNIDNTEIDNMIVLEMADKNIKAIVLDAEIMTVEFSFGKYRDDSGRLLNTDSMDMKDKLSDNAFLTLDQKISKEGVIIGHITVIGTDRYLKQNLSNLMLHISFLTALTGILVSFLTIICLKAMVIKPLKALEEATITIKKGDLNAAVGYSSGDEIGRVILSFNKMAQQLEKNFKALKTAHKALQKSQETFSGFFNQGNMGMAISSIEKGVTNVNIKACDIIGYSKDELIGMAWTDFTYPGDLEKDLVQFEKMTTGKIDNYEKEMRFLSKNGDIIHTYLTVSCIRHKDGSVNKLLITAQDISAQKKIEKEKENLEGQLRQTRKLESLGTLAGGVAHDFNNLLSIILGYSELLMKTVDTGHRNHKFSKAIYDSAVRAKSVTRQLLAFSRKQVLETKVLDVNQVIRNFEKMIKRFISEDIELKFELMTDQVFVKADISQMEQVLMNLSINAKDAMKDGGILTIETDTVELDETYPHSNADITQGSHAMISFIDTGIGIPEDHINDIFEPFFTTKKEGEGTGLGLSTVYGIVKQHGGNIRVLSETGIGSTFKIYLPQTTESAAQGQKTPSEPDPVFEPTTVLLVEDEPNVRLLIREILSELGHEVIDTESTEDAIQKAKEYKSTIDLVIADVIMPTMKGPEVYQHILRYQAEAKILYISGYTNDVISRHGVLKKGVQLLHKPFSKKALIHKIAQVLSA